MTVKEVLKKAVKLLKKHGWCRGTQCDLDGRMCAAGVIQKVVTGEPYYWNWSSRSLQERSMKAIAKALGFKDQPTRQVVSWNNGTYKSMAQVIRTFQKASRNS